MLIVAFIWGVSGAFNIVRLAGDKTVPSPLSPLFAPKVAPPPPPHVYRYRGRMPSFRIEWSSEALPSACARMRQGRQAGNARLHGVLFKNGRGLY